MRKESTRAGRLWVLTFAILAACMVFFGKPVKANSYSDATLLPMDGQWVNNNVTPRSGGSTKDGLWFRIEVPSDGLLSIKTQVFSDSGALGIAMYSEDTTKNYNISGGPIFHNTATSPSAEEQKIAVSKGSYYLRYYEWLLDSPEINFNTCLTFSSYGTNDADAVSYQSPQTYYFGQNIIGAVTQMKEEDWFKFHVEGEKNFQMLVSSYMSDPFSYTLYNSDLTNTIKSDTMYGNADTPTAKMVEFKLGTGDYYLKFRNSSGGSAPVLGKYTFILNDVTPAPTPTPTPSVTPVAPSVPSTPSFTDTTVKEVSAFKAAARKIKVKVSPRKKKAKVSWKKINSASGYQIRYSKKKSMKGSKTVRVAGASKKSKVIKKLATKKKYYFQVRAYKVINGQTYYGTWSSKKAARIKK